MKKILAFALCAVTALLLVACGNNRKAEESSPEIPDPFTECETMDEAARPCLKNKYCTKEESM